MTSVPCGHLDSRSARIEHLVDWLIERYAHVVAWSLRERLTAYKTSDARDIQQEVCGAICDFAEEAEEAEPGASLAFERKLDELDRRFN